MTKNIRGEFPITIDGKEYSTKCNFELIERLERHVLNRAIFSALHDAMNGDILFTEIVDVIHAGMKAAKDARLSRNDLGEALHKDGFQNHIAWYVDFLTYALTGETNPETE